MIYYKNIDFIKLLNIRELKCSFKVKTMLTVADIRNKVNTFPENKSVEELFNELLLLYKIEKGIKEADENKGIPLSQYEKEIEQWWKLK